MLVPFPTPEGAEWENVLIRIVDRESAFVEVEVKGVKANHPYTYIALGLGDTRGKGSNICKPTMLWDLLLRFARRDQIGSADAASIRRLRGVLREIFGIEGNPIPFRRDKPLGPRYQPKFLLQYHVDD